MSIEKLISDLTIAVNGLTAAIAQQGIAANLGASTVPQAPAPYANVGAQSMQNLVAAVAPQAPAPAAAQMPAPPSFAPPVQPQFGLQQGPAAPFADSAGLIAYVMAAYKEMGPQKGAQIQNVLGGLGVANINDVKPEQYGALYQGVEALKRG